MLYFCDILSHLIGALPPCAGKEATVAKSSIFLPLVEPQAFLNDIEDAAVLKNRRCILARKSCKDHH